MRIMKREADGAVRQCTGDSEMKWIYVGSSLAYQIAPQASAPWNVVESSTFKSESESNFSTS